MKPDPEWAGLPAPNPSELSVFEYMGKLVADSRKVAPFVEKDHAHLLRDICVPISSARKRAAP